MSGSLSVTMNNFRAGYGYVRKGFEVLPELVLGNAGEKMGEAMRTQKGTIFSKIEAGWRALDKAGSGSFFKGLWQNMKSFIPDIKNSIKIRASQANIANQSKFVGGIKGLFEGLGKKMPFIASLSMIAFELPNIFKATVEQGIFQGGAEVVKAGARLTGASIGAAIGSAMIPIPFVGAIVGWTAGEWLTSRIVGKSYTEQKAEKEEEQQQAQNQPQQPYQPQLEPPASNPYWLNGQNQQQISQLDNNLHAPQAPQTQQMPPAFNPSMQGTMPQFTGLYNPFAAQTNPYADDIMNPFNKMM